MFTLALAIVAAAVGYLREAVSNRQQHSSEQRYNSPQSNSTWSQRAALKYLADRETWWINWDGAKRENGTFCISCHTNVPFIAVTAILDRSNADSEIVDNAGKIIANVKYRVREWNSTAPYYGEKEDKQGLGAASRSTEAILNALVLILDDSRTGRFSEEAKSALQAMWDLQISSGAERGGWKWQRFRLSPWEARESPYIGATLAALAVGYAPESYRSSPGVRQHLDDLRGYLNRGYAEQPLFSRTGLLWASTKWPELLSDEKWHEIVTEVCGKQQSDGGWSMPSLMWSNQYFGIPSLVTTHWRNDRTLQETSSDGFATAYLAFVLEQAGTPRKAPPLRNALAWLARNQNPNGGYWLAYSLNRKRDPASKTGLFMTDAATAFAVLALSNTDNSKSM